MQDLHGLRGLLDLLIKNKKTLKVCWYQSELSKAHILNKKLFYGETQYLLCCFAFFCCCCISFPCVLRQ